MAMHRGDGRAAKCQKRMMKSKSRWMIGRQSAMPAFGVAAPSFRSKPAQKARPAPVSTRARTDVVALDGVEQRVQLVDHRRLMAFSRSGRFKRDEADAAAVLELMVS